LGFAQPARAGEKVATAAFVDTASKIAGGSLGTARNSSDGLQVVSCGLSQSGNNVFASCFVRDAAGHQASCNSISPSITQTIAAVSGDSYVEFLWDASGACTFVEVINSSKSEPKIPDVSCGGGGAPMPF